MALNVKFLKGTQEEYNNVAVKDSNTFYYLSDVQELYLGTIQLSNESSSDDLTEVINRLAAAEGSIESLQSDVETAQSDISTLQSSVETAQSDISTLQTNVETTQGDITTLKSDVETAQDSISSLQSDVETLQTSSSDYLTNAIVSISAAQTDDKSGTVLTITDAAGEVTDITVADLFLSGAVYDSDTHILSLTVTGQEEPVQVDLADLIPETATVDADDVALARNITATVDVGNISKGDVIDISSIKSVQALFEAILSQDSNPTTTQPSVKITLSSAGAKEVGSTFTPSYTTTFSAGSYSDNASGAQATGVTATEYAVTASDGSTASTASGSFDAFTVDDDTSYYVSVVVSYSDGNVPTTYLGTEYPDGQIMAGTCSATSSKVTGYRAGFYGTSTDKTADIDSDLVRSLTSTGKAVVKGQTYTITIPVGAMRVVVAYPATIGELASVTSAEQFGSEIGASFTLYTVDVNDASGSNAISYNVYVKDLAVAQETATTYTVTI